MTQIGDADRATTGGRTPWLLIALVLLVSLLVRLPFLSNHVYQNDPVNYCWGALVIGVAHAPGYAGYCFLGHIVNYLFHDINRSFVLINLAFSLGAIALIYPVARRIGLSVAAALVAMVSMSLSVNVLMNSVCGMNHAAEGCLTTLFALLAVRAIQTRKPSFAIAGTIVFAIAGALRPSTTMLLTPLWLYTIFASGPKLPRIGLHLLIAIPIIAGWLYWNRVLMEKADIADTTYDLQVMMPANYDYSRVNTGEEIPRDAKPSFHMPVFEFIACAERETGIRLLPHGSNWPDPSFTRAARLSAVQASKLVFYIFFSAPIIAAYLIFLIVQRKSIPWPDGWLARFFGFWLVPPLLFYVFGHLGAFGYLQVLLPGVIVLCCLGLLGTEGSAAPARARIYASIAPALLSLLFFVLSRPFHATSGGKRAADLLALQYTGAAVRQNFATSRAASSFADLGQVQPASIRQTHSDEEFVALLKSLDYTPSIRKSSLTPRPSTAPSN
jgi:hypothetical protein